MDAVIQSTPGAKALEGLGSGSQGGSGVRCSRAKGVSRSWRGHGAWLAGEKARRRAY